MIFDFLEQSRAEPFFAEYEHTYLHGNTLGTENTLPPEILFLHGQSQTEDRNVFLLLRQILFDQYKISSCAFDFVGHGTTGGKWSESCLSSRTEQASNIINACFDSQSLIVVASDMGTYTALKLVERFPIDGLVLINPTVYALEVYRSTLNSLGENNVRFADHWDKTDAWSIIARFTGSLSIVETNKDDPLCPGTMSRLYSHATRSSRRQAFEISHGQRKGESLAYCAQSSSELKRLAEIISQSSNNKVQEEGVLMAL